MSILFYCTFKNKDQWLRSIKKKFKKEIVYSPNNKLDYSKINYAIVWNLPDKIYSKLNNIKIIFSLGAGVDHIIKLPSYRKTPIIRVKDVNMAKRMSYHVHSQILSYQLKLYLFQQAQIKRQWLGEQYTKLNSEITVGILGLGFLGKSVANYLMKLKYNVIGFKKENKNLKNNMKIYTSKNLKTFLGKSDIVVSILPNTNETKDFIDSSFLNKMKKEALLINIGRGSTLNEIDLLKHINKNKNFFASLDVFKIEPLPKKNKFWNNKNVTVTPHAAALTDINSTIDLMYKKYLSFKKNGNIKSHVNLNKGY